MRASVTVVSTQHVRHDRNGLFIKLSTENGYQFKTSTVPGFGSAEFNQSFQFNVQPWARLHVRVHDSDLAGDAVGTAFVCLSDTPEEKEIVLPVHKSFRDTQPSGIVVLRIRSL